MYVPFKELPGNSKVWIYQSEREFTSDELTWLNDELKTFTTEWTVHSQTLKSSYDIRHGYFIILGVDQSLNDTSGCSIDSSVRIIKKIGDHLNIDFFKRENLLFSTNENIEIVSISDIKQHKNKNINIQSEFFNNLVNSIDDLTENWLIKVEKSWLNPFFK